jgi:hypothetical protein
MTPREVIPAEINEEVEAEVSASLTKMVADERRYSTPDPRIVKLETALRKIAKINSRPDRFNIEIDAVVIEALGFRIVEAAGEPWEIPVKDFT